MDLDHLAAMAASYDANASDREEVGEPDWRDEIRDDFVARLPKGACFFAAAIRSAGGEGD